MHLVSTHPASVPPRTHVPSTPSSAVQNAQAPAPHRLWQAAVIISLGGLSPLLFGQAAPTSGEVVKLDRVVVSKSDETGGIAKAAAALRQVPGSNRLVNNDLQLRDNPALSQKAIFDFQPGIYAQGSGTSESVKISIRGSGLAGAVTYNRSINLLFDGLTFAGFAMSGHSVAFNETLGLDHTEVLIGSNGFDQQSLGLGGAINYVSKTGYTADRALVRFDGGSFGYFSAQVSSGQVLGKNDYYASLVVSNSDGFQVQSRKEAVRLLANFGHKFNENVSTRFYVRATPRLFNESPGNLSLNQIFADREQANAVNLAVDSYQLTKKAFWVGSKTNIKIDADSSLIVGGSFDYNPFWINSRNAVIDNQLSTTFNQSNLTYVAQYERTGLLGDQGGVTRIGFRGIQVLKGNNDAINLSNYAPKASTYGQVVRGRDTDGTGNQVLSVSHDQKLSNGFAVKVGASAIHTRTVNYVEVANPLWSVGAIDNSHAVSDEEDYNWIAGVTYDATKDIQLYANASRSVEQPTGLTKSAAATNSSSKDLLNQTGLTFETGVRGRTSIFEGSLSVYRTELKNEFLTQLVTQTISDTVNSSSPTIHQGVEAALLATLWADGTNEKGAGSTLTFRQSYTFNDFFFDDHPVYKRNEIPSISRHLYQAELRYTSGLGYYIAANTRAASSYDAEYNNYGSYEVPGYAILGAIVGYQAQTGRWNAYVSFNNILDKTYIVSTRPAASTAANINNGRTTQQLHSVGDPFSVYGGFSLRF